MSKDAALIERTKDYIRHALKGDSSGHDWHHIDRVMRTALVLAKKENADMTIVALAALLHDIADYKMYNGDTEIGPKVAREWLEGQGVDAASVDHICGIIRDISFKGAGTPTPMSTLEGQIVQDADRLDAIGAMGIARAFAFGGAKGRVLYDPDIKPVLHKDFESYKTSESSSLNHFYEKLLLLKDRMNTKAAKKLAAHRHDFMLAYLDEFHKEWDGKA